MLVSNNESSLTARLIFLCAAYCSNCGRSIVCGPVSSMPSEPQSSGSCALRGHHCRVRGSPSVARSGPCHCFRPFLLLCFLSLLWVCCRVDSTTCFMLLAGVLLVQYPHAQSWRTCHRRIAMDVHTRCDWRRSGPRLAFLHWIACLVRL